MNLYIYDSFKIKKNVYMRILKDTEESYSFPFLNIFGVDA